MAGHTGAAKVPPVGSEAQAVVQKNAGADTHHNLLPSRPVKMRDGVTLRADIPSSSRRRQVPVLVYRTPYGKDQAPGQWNTFDKAVDRGYAVVIQDVRGRYASDGEFDPYQNEGRDGYDTIEWAAAQPWSNGSVGPSGFRIPARCSGSPRWKIRRT